MNKIVKYVIVDILRSKVVLLYTFLLAAISISLFILESDSEKAVISLLSIVLIITPLISLIFGTTYYYNAYEFMQVLLTQPIPRKTILLSQYSGVAVSLTTSYLCGIGIPILILDGTSTGWMLITTGVLLTLSFTAFAFLAAVYTRDKARGIGLALLIWFYFAIIYDALIMGIMYTFCEYPIEKFVFVFAALNPIDLSRILILLKLDISTMMGYTGAIYKDFLGTNLGIITSILTLLFWIILPIYLASKWFKKKNI